MTTPCQERGYKIGDLFVVTNSLYETCFTKGSIIQLVEDDESVMPGFDLLFGEVTTPWCRGTTNRFVHLGNIKSLTGHTYEN